MKEGVMRGITFSYLFWIGSITCVLRVFNDVVERVYWQYVGNFVLYKNTCSYTVNSRTSQTIFRFFFCTFILEVFRFTQTFDIWPHLRVQN